MVVSARTKCIWHRSNQTLMHSTTAPRDLKVHFITKVPAQLDTFRLSFPLACNAFLIQTDVKKLHFNCSIGWQKFIPTNVGDTFNTCKTGSQSAF